MIKKLVAFGDSFTWGHDLNDLSKTWGNITAQHFNLQYECIAEGGRSNDSIARHCFEYCQNNDLKDNLITIMWTYPIRHEIYLKVSYTADSVPTNYFCISSWHSLSFDERLYTFNLENNDLDFWKKKYQIESITGIIDIARIFESRLAFQHWYILNLKNQLFLKNYLESKSIPYVFLYASKEVINHTFNKKESYIKALTDEILTGNIIGLEEGGFIEISKTHKFPTGKTNHPLEEAHDYFAKKYLIPFIIANIPF